MAEEKKSTAKAAAVTPGGTPVKADGTKLTGPATGEEERKDAPKPAKEEKVDAANSGIASNLRSDTARSPSDYEVGQGSSLIDAPAPTLDPPTNYDPATRSNPKPEQIGSIGALDSREPAKE